MAKLGSAAVVAFAIAMVALCAVPLGVRSHAYLAEPVSRNYQARLDNLFYCPHCGQGNGGVPDACGNPFQGTTDPNFNFTQPRWYKGFKATWTAGQVVNITIQMSTNHGGRMKMSLCHRNRFEIYGSCFNEPANQLRRVNADPKYDSKVYWYLKPSDWTVSETFRLPSGVTCADGCVLQWWWWGYQNCYLPCAGPADDVAGECGVSVNGSGQCAVVTQTEQFANCADVLILPADGSIPTPAPTPAPTSAPTTAPTTSAPTTWAPTTSAPTTSAPTTSAPTTSAPTPAPTPEPTPAPVPGPTPAPTPAPVCPSGEWKCTECARLGSNAAASLGADLTLPCQQCAAVQTDGWACHNCFASSTNLDVLRGCLSCAKAGGGAACSQVCAAKSRSGLVMSQCAACSAASGNSWACGNCFDKAAGSAAKRDTCLSCVADRFDAYGCGECAGRYGTACEAAACTDCIRANPYNAWGCYTASYAAACGTGGRRMLAERRTA